MDILDENATSRIETLEIDALLEQALDMDAQSISNDLPIIETIAVETIESNDVDLTGDLSELIHAASGHSPVKSFGEPHLKIQLTATLPAFLVMQQVQEVLVLPMHRLTPMPNMPAGILGLMNRRSRVIWVVDLLHLLGLGSVIAQNQQYNLVVVRTPQQVLGLAVHQIGALSGIPSELIQPHADSADDPVASSMQPYVQGYVTHPQPIVVLDAAAIAHAPILHAA